MIFVADENVQVGITKLLAVFDSRNQFQLLLESVAQGTRDVEWIQKLAAWDPKPVVISGDSRILSNRVESRALKVSRLTWVALGKGWIEAPWETVAWKIIKAWPEIRQSVRAADRPTVFEVAFRTLKIVRRFDL
jgi:hypothetical protein